MTTPPEAIRLEKRAIRARLREEAAAISGDLREAYSMAAAALLVRQEAWRQAEMILGYIPLKDELNLLPCLEQALAEGKRVALPRYVPERGGYCAACADGQLIAGPFGIAEPPACAPVAMLKPLDLLLVPGLGFAPDGRRLGRGKGFYDRLLAEIHGVKCGVALEEQIVARLPFEAHDIRMNYILTPTRWMAVPPEGT